MSKLAVSLVLFIIFIALFLTLCVFTYNDRQAENIYSLYSIETKAIGILCLIDIMIFCFIWRILRRIFGLLSIIISSIGMNQLFTHSTDQSINDFFIFFVFMIIGGIYLFVKESSNGE